ncbi:hypothetical protein [Bacillus thuringiensis]|uniref:hypothetical protein n=1 Tax=Bacillus thuringiensis TaxID=1428 RepID=UPI003BF6E2E5
MGGQLLDIDEHAGDIPFFLFGDIPIPGSVKGEAFIKDMLPIQREINILCGLCLPHMPGKWEIVCGYVQWVPLWMKMKLRMKKAVSCTIHRLKGRDQRVGAPDIPSFYDRILNNHDGDIDDLSGAREISQGRLPAGLDTYSGLSLMVEQENEKLAVSSKTMNPDEELYNACCCS